MPTLTIIYGALALALGLSGFFYSMMTAQGGERIHWTALIPALIGMLALVLGVMARRPGARKPASHAAVVLAGLAALACLRFVLMLFDAQKMQEASGVAMTAGLGLFTLSVAYVLLGVRSFMTARARLRQAQQSERLAAEA